MVEQTNVSDTLSNILARTGIDAELRNSIFEALRKAELSADDKLDFRNNIRWPLLVAILRDIKQHRVRLSNGLFFDVGTESRIERSLLLSTNAFPDHVWEPQTTKLLVSLGTEGKDVIIGGAYIGDHALLIAQDMTRKKLDSKVHAFEPDTAAFNRLLKHLEVNQISNVVTNQLGLWERGDVLLSIEGDAALASTSVIDKDNSLPGGIKSISIDDYVKSKNIQSLGLIMLDTEGAEEKGLLGADWVLSQNYPDAPNLVFEVHRSYVDWSDGLENTSIVRYVMSKGYQVFAIRDFHDNYPMAGKEIEIVPIKDTYLEGPPHGFNLLATKDVDLINRLGLSVVKNVSPKLLLDKNPALHHPLSGL